MTLICDNREPHGPDGLLHPWQAYWSEDIRVIRGTLETGDVALAALPDAALAERKSTSDLYQCLGRERSRFEAELRRGRYCGRLVVVSEGSVADLLCEARRRGGGMSAASIIGTLAAWQRRYCPFFFAGMIAEESRLKDW